MSMIRVLKRLLAMPKHLVFARTRNMTTGESFTVTYNGTKMEITFARIGNMSDDHTKRMFTAREVDGNREGTAYTSIYRPLSSTVESAIQDALENEHQERPIVNSIQQDFN